MASDVFAHQQEQTARTRLLLFSAAAAVGLLGVIGAGFTFYGISKGSGFWWLPATGSVLCLWAAVLGLVQYLAAILGRQP